MITDRPHYLLPIVLALRLTFVAVARPAVILDVDWDVVLSIVLGIAGIGYVVIDHRRVTKLDEWGQSLGERVATLEAQIAGQSQHTIPERIAALEATGDLVHGLVEDVASLRERASVLETKADPDYKPARNRNGRFVSMGAAACEDPRIAGK